MVGEMIQNRQAVIISSSDIKGGQNLVQFHNHRFTIYLEISICDLYLESSLAFWEHDSYINPQGSY